MFTKVIYAPGTLVTSANLNEIQDELVGANGATFEPTMVGIANGDISARLGWFNRVGGLVNLHVLLAWNNTNAGTAGDPVEIDLPFEASDYSLGGGPSFSYAWANPTVSLWTDQGTDRAIQALISHTSGFQTLIVTRISTTNTSLGAIVNDMAVARQLLIQISYPTDGSFLL